MADPITLGTFAVWIGIAALKGVFSNKEWGFDAVEGAVAGGALDVAKEIITALKKRSALKKQLSDAASNARDWLANRSDYAQIHPVIAEVCGKDWNEFTAALKDLPKDLHGWRVRATIGRIFETPEHDTDVGRRAADAFYEALLRALLSIADFSATAQRLLLDLDESARERLIADMKTHFDARFAALLDPKPLIIWPYRDLPSRDGRLSELLIARHGVVPFLGREKAIQTILDWCVDADSVKARLYLAGGGEGKTRFFAEACARLMSRPDESWTAGWINIDRYTAEPARLDELLGRKGGVLLGIDYAGSEIERVIPLVNHLATAGAHAKVRLVLLERDKGYWWETLRAEAGSIIAHAIVETLSPLGKELNRVGVFASAYGSFREILPGKPTPTTNPDLKRDEFSNVLFIVMAAALAATGDPTPTADGVLDRVLDHERKWRDRRAKTLPTSPHPTHLKIAIALGTLVDGLKDRETASAVLRKIPEFQDSSLESLENVSLAIGGSVTGKEQFLPALKPDRLGERMLETIFESEDFTIAQKILTCVFGCREEFLKERGFGVLARMAVRNPQGDWLDKLATTDLIYSLQERTLSLRDFAAKFTERAANIRPARIPDPDLSSNERAYLLNAWSNRLAALGRPEDALVAARDALNIYRTLAQVRTAEFLHSMAGSLNTVASSLSAIGHHEEALEAVQEAITIYHNEIQVGFENLRPDLALSKVNEAKFLFDLGRREEAIGAASEAATIYRELSKEQPARFRPNFAMSLNNLANCFATLGRREEALETGQEAVAIYRDLASSHPDAFLPDLALSLNNVATHLADIGRREEALGTAQEAKNLYRELAANHPNAFRPDFAMSLSALSKCFSSVGRREEALETSLAALEIRRVIAANRPDAFRPDLAKSLSITAVRFADLGRLEEAMEAAQEAVEIYRDLAAARPDAFLPDLAGSLNNMSNFLSDFGCREEALEMTWESVKILRNLSTAIPDAFLPDLAISLSTLANRLRDQCRYDEALVAACEAAEIRRGLAATCPDIFYPDLAKSCGCLGSIYDKLEIWIEAAASFEEGSRILLPFFFRFPTAFGGLMTALVERYFASCDKAGIEPDNALVSEIKKILKS